MRRRTYDGGRGRAFVATLTAHIAVNVATDSGSSNIADFAVLWAEKSEKLRAGPYGLSLRPVLKRYCDHATTASVNAAVTANESHTGTSLVPRKP